MRGYRDGRLRAQRAAVLGVYGGVPGVGRVMRGHVIDVSALTHARLQAEASRRGMTIRKLLAELVYLWLRDTRSGLRR
jgi:hypothetical protein